MKKLKGKVCLVTGASRGVGRGIAVSLGEQGAIVYVTGRSVRDEPTTEGMPGTIDDTADEISRRGGEGIAVRCDHTDDAQVAALFERIGNEHGHIDVLVNNAWGGYEEHRVMPCYFWEADLKLWDRMFTRGLRVQLVATRFALPLMIPRRRGLVVNTVVWDRDQYIGGFYDLAKNASVRMVWGLAQELKQFRIAAVAVAPGFTRTERVLSAFQTDEAHWRDFPGLARSESPEYPGRAVAALAADRNVLKKSGRAFQSGQLAREYRFRDVDGRYIPGFHMDEPYVDMVRQFKKKYAAKGASHA